MNRVALLLISAWLSLAPVLAGTISIPFPGPGGVSGAAVPIGTPTLVGKFTSAAGTNVSTCVTPITNAIVAGDLVVNAVQIPSGTLRTVSSMSDGTNTYTLGVAIDDGANFRLEIWYKENATAVASGNITATLSGTTSGSNGIACEAAQVSGVLTSSSLDKTATQSANTLTPTVTTATLSTANQIGFGVSYTSVTIGGTYTQATGFTSITSPATINITGIDGSARGNVGWGYRIQTASTTAMTFAPIWVGASSTTETAIATFKGN